MSIVAAVGLLLGMSINGAKEPLIREMDLDQFSLNQALQLINSQYYGELDEDSLIANLIDETNQNLDAYSHYYAPSEILDYKHYISGSFFGWGIDLWHYEGNYYIIHSESHATSDSTGLLPGDRLINIMNRSTAEMLPDSINGLFAARDSLEITIRRVDQPVPVKMSLAKREIARRNLISTRIVQSDDTVSYLKILRFDNNTFSEFMDALYDHAGHSPQPLSLMIDLRDNPGGRMDEALKVLNQLIDDRDQLMLTTIDKAGQRKEYKSNGRTFLPIGQVAVLINQNTASSAEIVAGTLQDVERAHIFGSKSYGKGLIQQSFTLANESKLHLTVGEYILPSGRTIHQSEGSDYGIIPDVERVTDSCRMSYHERRDAVYRQLYSNTTNIGGYVLNCGAPNSDQALTQMDHECQQSLFDFRAQYLLGYHMKPDRVYHASCFDSDVQSALSLWFE